jgi:hypothetical protein
MADNSELQTARVIRLGPGSFVDNDFRNVEAALRLLFGVTADSDYEEAMQIGTGPNIVMSHDLTLAQAPTADLHAATKKYVDDEGNVAASTRCTVVTTGGTQTILAGVDDPIDWEDVEIEEGGDCWDAGEPTRIMFPVAGDYLITGCIQAVNIVAGIPAFAVSMYLDGIAWMYTLLAYGSNQNDGGAYAGAPFAVMDRMEKDDYIEIYVNAVGVNHGISDECRVTIMKVG